MILRFRAEPGQASNLRLRVYTLDRGALLGTFDSLPGSTPPNPFTEEVPGSYSCDVGALAGEWFISVSLLDTSEVTVDGFASDGDPELRADIASSIELTSDSEDAIALSVYQRIAGARAALLNAPLPAGTPLDTIITADFDYTVPVVVADTSEVIWFIRIRPKSTDALLIAKKSAGPT